MLGNPADIGDEVDAEILTPSAPVLRTIHTTPVRPIHVGDQMVITTQVTNNDPVNDWSSYVLVEVRDQEGITVMLGWQSGIFEVGSQKDVGISWTPDTPGNYQLRTFVITDFQNPRVMSSVQDSQVTIAEASEATDGLCSGSASCFTGIVINIVDGDTLDVNDNRVRLSLVDTPEVDEAGYHEATEFSSELCLVGSNVLVDQDDGQPFDDFGRMIAKVTCEGDMIINAELLESGHAKVMTEYCAESEFSLQGWLQGGCDFRIHPDKLEEYQAEARDCDPSYPDVCVPPPPPDLDCGDISFRNFRVVGSDPHRFDSNNDGLACEG
jgi:micrococcal nuclease